MSGISDAAKYSIVLKEWIKSVESSLGSLTSEIKTVSDLSKIIREYQLDITFIYEDNGNDSVDPLSLEFLNSGFVTELIKEFTLDENIIFVSVADKLFSFRHRMYPETYDPCIHVLKDQVKICICTEKYKNIKDLHSAIITNRDYLLLTMLLQSLIAENMGNLKYDDVFISETMCTIYVARKRYTITKNEHSNLPKYVITSE